MESITYFWNQGYAGIVSKQPTELEQLGLSRNFQKTSDRARTVGALQELLESIPYNQNNKGSAEIVGKHHIEQEQEGALQVLLENIPQNQNKKGLCRNCQKTSDRTRTRRGSAETVRKHHNNQNSRGSARIVRKHHIELEQ